jgi:starch synthase (maltosyl-transferring)
MSDRRQPDRVPLPDEGRRRVVIAQVLPEIDGGRFPIKRTPGETVRVEADLFADGHDKIAAVLRFRERAEPSKPFPSVLHVPRVSETQPVPEIEPIRTQQSRTPQTMHVAVYESNEEDAIWHETPMELVENDRWTAEFAVETVGWYEYTVEAWVDHFASWRHALEARIKAGQDIRPELLEGSALVKAAAARSPVGPERRWLLDAASALAADGSADERARVALSPDLMIRMAGAPDRRLSSTYPRTLTVKVDREIARTGAWYEMFPRSARTDLSDGERAGTEPLRSATFAEAANRLPDIAAMGFDVVYLPPIHPIGRTFRKGRGNALTAGPGDPGSPWAIGGPEGGHTAVEPGLGTIDDFDAFRAEAERLGLEVALDLAYQCSPDHPYVTEHPEWFRHRPDGSINYAENPPKKYQDIYPFDFETDEWRALWRELRDVVLFWVGHGVRIFRVDNPHTKPFGFWEWLIADVHQRDPGVIFLAEAFTRPKVMKHLAKLGFTQSYTYFTWRNTKKEIEEYFTELTTTEMREYYRPNLFANTPDILHAFLQQGGPPAFRIRAVLAATLGATYGIYSGFEIAEGRGVPSSEEYADSEKYQIRVWDWNRPGHLTDLITRLNQIRHTHRALQFNEGLRFHLTTSDHIVAYSKVAPAPSTRERALRAPAHSLRASDAVRLLTVVSLDPKAVRDGWICVSLADDPVPDDERYSVHDLLSGARFEWTGAWNYVRLDPVGTPAHLLLIERTSAAASRATADKRPA